jgi:hypothetical protein
VTFALSLKITIAVVVLHIGLSIYNFDSAAAYQITKNILNEIAKATSTR